MGAGPRHACPHPSRCPLQPTAPSSHGKHSTASNTPPEGESSPIPEPFQSTHPFSQPHIPPHYPAHEDSSTPLASYVALIFIFHDSDPASLLIQEGGLRAGIPVTPALHPKPVRVRPGSAPTLTCASPAKARAAAGGQEWGVRGSQRPGPGPSAPAGAPPAASR